MPLQLSRCRDLELMQLRFKGRVLIRGNGVLNP